MKNESCIALTASELSALDGLCDLANAHRQNKSKQLTNGKAEEGRPLRLQNLDTPARVKAVKVMIDFAAGAKYADSLVKHGLTALEFSVIRHKDHNFGLVWEAAKRVKAADTAILAADGLRRLTTEEGCELNAKAVMFALERLDGKNYGKPDAGVAGGGSSAKSVYNIVIQGFSTAQPCDNRVATTVQSPVIDINPNE